MREGRERATSKESAECQDDRSASANPPDNSSTDQRKGVSSELFFCQQRRELALAHLPVVLFQVDREGTFLLSEGKGLQTLGLKPGEAVGQSVFEILADRPEICEHIRRALRGENFQATVRVNNCVFDTTYSPLRDLSDQVVGVIGVAIEVTEKVELRERELENARFQNRQNEALWRLTRTQVLGAGDLAAALRAITEVAAQTLQVSRVGVWFYNADRTKIRCIELFELGKGHISDEMELRASEYPRYFHSLEQGRDIAAHDAHTDPRTSEFRDIYLREVGISSMLDAPIHLRGEMVGVVCHEHVGTKREWTPQEESFSGSVADMVALAMEAAERARAERELRLAHADLEERVRARTAELQRAYSGLQEAEAQLIHSEKMAAIGQLVAGVAHEINNPAAFVLSNITAIRRNLDDILAYHNVCTELETAAQELVPDLARKASRIRQRRSVDEAVTEAMELLEAAKGGMSRIRDLIVNLQAFSRIDLRGGHGFAHLNEGLQATLLLLKPILSDNIKLELSLNEVPQVECNIGHINQVFMNLLANAVQAIQPAGTVRIETGRSGDGVEVLVCDSGAGIPDSMREKIFEPFFTTKDAGKGTGLGLPISRRIVEAHHGRLELVDSEVGACFRVWLPIRQPTAIAPSDTA